MSIEPEADFVDVRRTFFRVDGAKPHKAEEVEAWAHWGGSTKWADLLKLHRVVVLAEANSGKTQEFRNQVSEINKSGGSAFFLAIESLARNDFALAMGADQMAQFEVWKTQATAGYIFLDSLDEAKLNQFSLETALRKLQQHVAGASDRLHLIVSSRGTDWDGSKDWNIILECFPPILKVDPLTDMDEDEALVSAIRRDKKDKVAENKSEFATNVFAMARLTVDQREIFLRQRGLADIDGFETALFRRGMIPMSERPGDLAMLLQYWTKNKTFGSLREMMEHSIDWRLAERAGRKDGGLLSLREVRHGSERLAAALTLSKKLTILSDENQVAANEGEAAINPNHVLSDWSADKVRALLRRGIFAPSTFGRIRFHHRSVVEYLAASWFKRIVEGPNSPAKKVVDVLTGVGFDLLTVPPSLRPVAAWLAPDFPQLLEILIDRDPLALIAFGDPAQLSIPARIRLLHIYATKDAAGAVSDLMIDAHALWMFADPKLESALKTAWAENDNADFRFNLLRLIELGKLTGCAELVRKTALDYGATKDNRIMAARALRAIDDTKGLESLAKDLLKNAATYSSRLAPELTLSLYPVALTTAQLLDVISQSPPARQFQVEGFGYSLERLFASCPSAADREALVAGLAKLGTQAPLEDYHHVSKAHYELVKHSAPMLRRAIVESDRDGVTDGLVRFLAIAGRADVDESVDVGQSLRSLINARPWLKRKVFALDIAEFFRHEPDAMTTPYVWWVHTAGRRLWILEEGDFDWLVEEVSGAQDEVYKRTAFSAAYDAARSSLAKLAILKIKFSSQAVLMADVQSFETPRKESDVEKRFRERRAEANAAAMLQFEKDAESWKRFRVELRTDIDQLSDRERIGVWPGAHPLYELTRWLAMKSGVELTKAPKEHARLIPAFGADVAAAYVSGMKALWRIVDPVRPVYDDEGRISFNKTSQLSVGGLNLEAQRPNWMIGLSPDLIVRAIQHAVFMERDAPEWFAEFLKTAPSKALDVVADELREEWKRPSSQPASFLSRFSHGVDAPEFLRRAIIDLIRTTEVADPGRGRDLNYLIARLKLSMAERRALAAVVRRRFEGYRAAAEWEWVACYLGVYFNLDIQEASKCFPVIISEQPENVRQERTISAIASLFSMTSGVVTSFDRATASTLKQLVLLSYGFVDPANDITHEGIYSSSVRDDAQDGRSRILGASIASGSGDAYRALRELAVDPRIVDRGRRFNQIATGMAERASEKPAWKEQEVERYEERLLSPVRTSTELLQLACEVIDELEREFSTWDYSIKPLVETAEGEFAVQNWLAREYQRFADGRYSTTREKQVKNDKRPDLALTALASGAEIAIEVKHGEKEWTLPTLKSAVKDQLGESYLLPMERRAGLFIITNHRDTRFWYSEDKSKRLSFAEVVSILTAYADGIRANRLGYIELAVRGLDASDGGARKLGAQKKVKKKTAKKVVKKPGKSKKTSRGIRKVAGRKTVTKRSRRTR